MPIVQPRLTYADLRELPEDGKRYELLEGELVASLMPTLKHQKVTGRTYAVLLRAEDAGYGEAYVAPVYVVFADDEVTEPDVIFIRRERLGIATASEVRGAPDLVVEVLSPSTRRRDLRVKMQIYARFGVPFYWVADPEAETVQPYELTPQGYAAQSTLRAGDTLGCPLFPGITVEVARLLH